MPKGRSGNRLAEQFESLNGSKVRFGQHLTRNIVCSALIWINSCAGGMSFGAMRRGIIDNSCKIQNKQFSSGSLIFDERTPVRKVSGRSRVVGGQVLF